MPYVPLFMRVCIARVARDIVSRTGLRVVEQVMWTDSGRPRCKDIRQNSGVFGVPGRSGSHDARGPSWLISSASLRQKSADCGPAPTPGTCGAVSRAGYAFL